MANAVILLDIKQGMKAVIWLLNTVTAVHLHNVPQPDMMLNSGVGLNKTISAAACKLRFKVLLYLVAFMVRVKKTEAKSNSFYYMFGRPHPCLIG